MPILKSYFFDKETKRTYRFVTEGDDPMTIYLPKTDFDGKPPAEIEVSITAK